jgi:hypothetical protein
VRIRFYIDPQTDQPHVNGHGVSVAEAREIVRRPLEQRGGREGSTIAFGRTAAGRYLKVVYALDDDGEGVFVITAYDPTPNEVRALRRRLKRKRQ